MLYEKYKPKSLQNVIGQPIAIRALTNIANNYDKNVIHGIILSGRHGCGKTLCATLFAHKLNDSEHGLMIIDGALNSSVDKTRELIEQIRYAPIDAKYRVILIEEAHMLSREAMDVLLLTLQAPPINTLFILTTTNIDKITSTLKSRCLIIYIYELSQDVIQEYLVKIAKLENMQVNSYAIQAIANKCQGSMRQALSNLEMIHLSNMNESEVDQYLGIISTENITDIFIYMIQGLPEQAWQLWISIKKNSDDKAFFVQMEQLIMNIIFHQNNLPNNLSNKLKMEEMKLSKSFLLSALDLLHHCCLIQAAEYNYSVAGFIYMLCHMDESFTIDRFDRDSIIADNKIKTVFNIQDIK